MRNNKEDEVKTRLTYENYENRFIWESPYSDVSMEDILEAFYGILVASTWQPATIIEAMGDFYEDHKYILGDDENDEIVYPDVYEEDDHFDPDPQDGFKTKNYGRDYPESSKTFEGFHGFPKLNDDVLPKGCTDITW